MFRSNEYKYLYRHLKTGGVYQIQGLGYYINEENKYETDELIFLKGHVEGGNKNVSAFNRIVNGTSFVFIVSEKFLINNQAITDNIRSLYKGQLQCSLTAYIVPMTPLVCYQNVNNETVWFRPVDEFFDGRFQEWGNTPEPQGEAHVK